MKTIIKKILYSDLHAPLYNFGILFFRVAISAELICVHGLKKVGVGVASAEVVPNPFGFPEALNSLLAIAANVYLPFFVLIGLCTRLAAIPAFIVTATGYFIMHFHDDPLVRDVPYMYSVSMLFIIVLGGGKYSIDYLIYKKLNGTL